MKVQLTKVDIWWGNKVGVIADLEPAVAKLLISNKCAVQADGVDNLSMKDETKKQRKIK